MHLCSFGAVGGGSFRLLDHGSGQKVWVTCGHKLSDPADGPSLRDSIQFRGDDGASTGMGLQDHGGKRLSGNLGMNQDIESVIEGNGIVLLTNQLGPISQPKVPNVFYQRRLERPFSRQKKSSLGESCHHLLGGTEKNPLSFAHWQVKAPYYAERNLLVFEAEFAPCGGGEGRFFWLKDGCVDSGMDDMEFFGVYPARVAVMAFGDGRGWIIVTLLQNLGDELRYGDDRIGVGEEMVSAQGRARAFGQMAGENDEGAGLDEAGGEESSPIVVTVVSMEDAGAHDPEESGQAKDLVGAEAGEGMKFEFCGFWRKGGVHRTGDFHRPASLGQSLGQRQALIVGAAAPQAGVELEHASDQRRGRHFQTIAISATKGQLGSLK